MNLRPMPLAIAKDLADVHWADRRTPYAVIVERFKVLQLLFPWKLGNREREIRFVQAGTDCKFGHDSLPV